MSDAPALRHADREMIPRMLLRAMFMLAMATLVLVGFAVLTDRPLVGQPLPSAVIAEREIVLTGTRDGAVTVGTSDGAVLANMSETEAGFVSVVWRGLDRNRQLHKVPATVPVNLVEYENGRLAIHDPATGWQVELASFGQSNRAAFATLLD